MPLLFGMDEAGYGPNLGPLVVSVVVWEVPGEVGTVDLWREFDGIISPEPATRGTHLQIADSKTVYTPARGLAALEAGVLGACALWQRSTSESARASTGESARESARLELPATFAKFVELVTAQPPGEKSADPWLAGADIDIPHAPSTNARARMCENRHAPLVEKLVEKWETRCRERGIRLRGIRSDVVSPSSSTVTRDSTAARGRR
jgi:hypothetical protein